MRMNDNISLVPVFIVGNANGTQAEFFRTKHETQMALSDSPESVWCDAIEMQIPEMKMSLICEDWRAALN